MYVSSLFWVRSTESEIEIEKEYNILQQYAECGNHSAGEVSGIPDIAGLLSPERPCRSPLLPELRLFFPTWPRGMSLLDTLGKTAVDVQHMYVGADIASDCPRPFSPQYGVHKSYIRLRAWVVWVSFLVSYLLDINYFYFRLFLEYFFNVLLHTRSLQRKQTAVRFAREDPQKARSPRRVDQTTCWLLSSSFYSVQHTLPFRAFCRGRIFAKALPFFLTFVFVLPGLGTHSTSSPPLGGNSRHNKLPCSPRDTHQTP